ncbi:MAG: hypothetical protein GY838_01140, partial [bacterium]|nr:hypothetical protein [bacterium]
MLRVDDGKADQTGVLIHLKAGPHPETSAIINGFWVDVEKTGLRGRLADYQDLACWVGRVRFEAEHVLAWFQVAAAAEAVLYRPDVRTCGRPAGRQAEEHHNSRNGRQP